MIKKKKTRQTFPINTELDINNLEILQVIVHRIELESQSGVAIIGAI